MSANAGPTAPGVAVDPVPRRILGTSLAGFTLIGWTALLLPSLIREVQGTFDQTDAGFGFLYFIGSLAYAVGSVGTGILHDRLGRRWLLATGVALIGGGLLVQALAPTWPALLLGVAIAGSGGGAIDAGLNGLFMDLFAERSGGPLNGLHLFYGVGAMLAPPIVGWLVLGGVDWRWAFAGTAVVALTLVLPMRSAGSLADRRSRPHHVAAGRRPPIGDRGPLLALAFALAFYVSSELSVSSWTVAYLADESLGLATLALGALWAGLAAGRLAAWRYADRFDPVALASTSAVVAGIAVAVVIVADLGAAAVAVLGVAGFAPIYPLIMSIGGRLYPGRTAQVSATLTVAGVVGSIVYPPLMGILSPVVGLGAGMAGAAALAICSGASIRTAGWLVSRRGATA
jgi:fucose permease